MSTTEIDVDKRRSRRGGFSTQPLLSATERRVHGVSARFNDSELALLQQSCAKAGMQCGEYLRAAALRKVMPSMPSINREAWVDLGHTRNTINQIARALNIPGEAVPVEEAMRTIDQFRLALIGLTFDSESDDT